MRRREPAYKFRFGEDGTIPLTNIDDTAHEREWHRADPPAWVWYCCCLIVVVLAMVIVFVCFNADLTAPRGACCARDACTNTTEAQCASLAPQSVYHGDNTTCEDHPCSVSCCCASEGAGAPVCVPETTYAECTRTDVPTPCVVRYDAGGCVGDNPCNATCCCISETGASAVVLPNQCLAPDVPTEPTLPDLTCPENACTGACCFLNECATSTSAACGIIDGGQFLGAGTECGACPTPPPAPARCCCLSFGIPVNVTNPELCSSASGSTLLDDPCGPDSCRSACCRPDGSCSFVVEIECLGEPQGLGTVCDPNTCPTLPPTPSPTPSVFGSCCLQGDGPTTCIEHITQAACHAFTANEFIATADFALNVQCDDGTCPRSAIPGACCAGPDDTCAADLSDSQCAAGGGTFMANSECDPESGTCQPLADCSCTEQIAIGAQILESACSDDIENPRRIVNVNVTCTDTRNVDVCDPRFIYIQISLRYANNTFSFINAFSTTVSDPQLCVPTGDSVECTVQSTPATSAFFLVNFSSIELVEEVTLFVRKTAEGDDNEVCGEAMGGTEARQC